MWPSQHDRLWHHLRLHGSSEHQPPDLLVRRFSLALLPPPSPPFTLALFSDLHWDGEPAQRLDRLISTVNTAAVDVVLFGGDLAAHLLHLPDALTHLSRLKARSACIAVRGNRESACSWLDAAFWRQRYGAAGFIYLQNETWLHAERSGALAIVGVDDERHGVPDFTPARASADAGRTVVTLTHNPDAVGERPGTFLGHLVLSGHTHGGQYRLPHLGPLFTSSRYWRQFDHGWRQRQDGTLLYVTSGAGETGYKALRRRIFCPPELVLITLIGKAAVTADAKEYP